MLVGNTSETKVAICFYKYSYRSPTAMLTLLRGKTKALWENESCVESRLLLTPLKYVAFEEATGGTWA